MCEPIQIIRFALYSPSLPLTLYTHSVFIPYLQYLVIICFHFFLLFERKKKKTQFIVVGIHSVHSWFACVARTYWIWWNFFDLTWTFFRSHFLSFLRSESMCNNSERQMMNEKRKRNLEISSEANVLGGRLISLCGYIWHSWCFCPLFEFVFVCVHGGFHLSSTSLLEQNIHKIYNMIRCTFYV